MSNQLPESEMWNHRRRKEKQERTRLLPRERLSEQILSRFSKEERAAIAAAAEKADLPVASFVRQLVLQEIGYAPTSSIAY